MESEFHAQGKVSRGTLSSLLHRTPLFVTGILSTGIFIGALAIGSWTMVPHTNAAQSGVGHPTTPNLSKGLESHGFSSIVKAITPAVVNITASKDVVVPMNGNPFDRMPDFFGLPDIPGFPKMPQGRQQGPDRHRESGTGSGVIVTTDGYILTNNHVVDNAKDVTVTLPDKREFKAKVIGIDPQTDLAVIKIDEKDLPTVRWGDASKLEVGEYVLAVGNPFGLNSTVTLGIVSALGRGGLGINQYEDFIQTDAAINPGNSGGALVNTNGELVGINTAIFSQTGGYQGIGFAVPTTMAKPVYASLVKTGKVVRGYLGIGIQEISPDLAGSFHLKEAHGALVTQVNPGSPAEQAGLQRGDVIVKYQGNNIRDPRMLQRFVTSTKVGDTVALSIIRDGHEKTLSTTVKEYPKTIEMAQAGSSEVGDGPLAGVAIQPLDEQLAGQLGVDSQTQGVVVTEVEPGSTADHAGLSRGDVISEINRKPVRSGEEYANLAGSLKKDQSALVFIHRGKVPLFLTLKG